MAESAAFHCNECGRPKGAGNHWYRAVRLMPGPRFYCVPWSERMILLESDPELHLCGMVCLVRCMSKAMSAT